MGWFGFKDTSVVNNALILQLRDLIVMLETRVSNIEIQLEGVLVRLKKKVYTEPEKEKEKEEKQKDLYSGVLLPDNGIGRSN